MGGVRKFVDLFENISPHGKNGTLHPGLSQESSFSPFFVNEEALWSWREGCSAGEGLAVPG